MQGGCDGHAQLAGRHIAGSDRSSDFGRIGLHARHAIGPIFDPTREASHDAVHKPKTSAPAPEKGPGRLFATIRRLATLEKEGMGGIGREGHIDTGFGIKT